MVSCLIQFLTNSVTIFQLQNCDRLTRFWANQKSANIFYRSKLYFGRKKQSFIFCGFDKNLDNIKKCFYYFFRKDALQKFANFFSQKDIRFKVFLCKNSRHQSEASIKVKARGNNRQRSQSFFSILRQRKARRGFFVLLETGTQ